MPPKIPGDRGQSSPNPGVTRYLIRYGAPGYVGWFGTIHRIEASRGAQVVVATDRGVELGEVLVAPQQTSLKQAAAEQGSPALTGELLRQASGEDCRLAVEIGAKHQPLVELCRRRVAELNIPVTLVDGEVLLDGSRAVIYFLGEATEKLGPLAVELGKAADLHVQFQLLEPSPGQPNPPAPAGEAAPQDKASRQETVKAESRAHWSQIIHDLGDPTKEKFSRDDAFLLQLHGVYQQEDRDAKNAAIAARKQAGPGAPSSRRRSFMIRTRPPGGRLTARQLLVHLDLAERFGNGTLRITSRQGLQIHGVAKGNIRGTLQGINAALLTTLGACGDVSRNVMCCPAPVREDRVRSRLQSLAAEIARHFTPHASPYFEIWLDEGASESAPHEEPVYGALYLPRKFKIALALPADNCVDVFTQDIGLVAAIEGDRLIGFNVLVGGGLGLTPGRDDTLARLAEPLAFAPAGEELRALDAIVQVHRSHGNRGDRRRARLKYLVADWGLPKFKAAVEEVLESALAAPRPYSVIGYDDHLGWRPQGDGRFYLGIPIPSGRISDTPDAALTTAIRTLLSKWDVPVRLTPQQNLLFCDLMSAHRHDVEEILFEAGITLADDLSPLRRHLLACPALPTCGLALAEAERMAPQLISQLEKELQRHGLADRPFTLRISGCPSGCARSATADVALVGRGTGRYAIYGGGGLLGDRLNSLCRDEVPEERLVEEILDILLRFGDSHLGAGSVSSRKRQG